MQAAHSDTTLFSIRRCTVGDAEVLASLGARLFAETYGPTHPEPELSRYLARTFSVDVMRQALSSSDVTMLIAESVGGTPAGYAFIRASVDRPTGVVGLRAFEIVRFYVDAKAQGRGVGGALMKACLDDARRRGAGVVWLQVWKEAPWAVGFYRRMGFAVVGSAPFYFGDQIGDDYIMSIAIAD
jgi:ribosomal protein S18 acetylase RimI-like enzyme